MANTRFTQFYYTKHMMPVQIDGNVVIGATGAVGTTIGPGISSVTRLAVGTYRVKFLDNYFKFYAFSGGFQSPVTGSSVPDGSFIANTVYQITAVGTTNWTAAGLPAGLTAAVGMIFKAANVGGAGTGTVKALGSSGVSSIDVAGNPQLELSPSGAANMGAYITIQCFDAAGAAVDPADTSVMFLKFLLSNSSVTVAGE